MKLTLLHCIMGTVESSVFGLTLEAKSQYVSNSAAFDFGPSFLKSVPQLYGGAILNCWSTPLKH